MPRHDAHADPLDPAVAEDLRRLEAALCGGESADGELVRLVEAVRADVAPPTLAFRTSLDERVAAGFPAGGGPRAWAAAVGHRLAALPLPLSPGPALGLAAAALIALVVGIGVLRDTGTTNNAATFSQGTVSSSVAKEAAPSSAAAAGAVPRQDNATREVVPQSGPVVPQSSPVAPTAAGTGTPSFGRKVQQSTRLALTADKGKLQATADGVVQVTQSAGGIVEQSDVNATDTGGTADFTLSIPTAKARDTVRRLSALAHVSAVNQSATDITGSFVAVVDRLSDARAERRALLKSLDAARTPGGIARLKGQIAANRNEIAGLKGQLNGLRHRADNTTVLVSLAAAEDKGSATPSTGGWSAGDAAKDALRVLEVAFGVLLVAIAVAVPLGLLVLPAAVGTRVARRRRREHALDAG
jgi:hypothetical protein